MSEENNETIKIPQQIILNDGFTGLEYQCKPSQCHYIFCDEVIPANINKADSILVELNQEDPSEVTVNNLLTFSKEYLAYDAFIQDKDEVNTLTISGLFNQSTMLETDNATRTPQTNSVEKQEAKENNFYEEIEELEKTFCLRNQTLQGILEMEENVFNSFQIEESKDEED